jgi:hypothetical protein
LTLPDNKSTAIQPSAMQLRKTLRYLFAITLMTLLLVACREEANKLTPSSTCAAYPPCIPTVIPTATPAPPAWTIPTGSEKILPSPLYYVSTREYENDQYCPLPHIVRIGHDGQTRDVVSSCFIFGGIYGFDVSSVDTSIALVGEGKLWVTDAIGENATLITPGLPDPEVGGDYFRMQSPTWSPDGTKIAYADGGIRIVDVATGEREDIIENECMDSDLGSSYRPCFYGIWYLDPKWSPDGSSILFRHQNADYYFQMIYELSEETTEKIGGTSGVSGDQIAWGRDGQHLFFDYWWPLDSIAPEPAFIQMRRDGSDIQILWAHGDRADPVFASSANNPWQVKYPFITSNGKILFFQAEPCDIESCYRYALVEGSYNGIDLTTQLIRKNALPQYADGILWHESGEYIAFWMRSNPFGRFYIGVMEIKSGETYLIAAEEFAQSNIYNSINLVWGFP